MPSGNTHDCIGVAAGILTLSAGVYYGYPQEATAAAVSLIFSTLFLSPDLDGKRSNSKRRWGPLKFIWWKFEDFKHRSIFTHVPVIADLVRLGYLACYIIPIALIVIYARGMDVKPVALQAYSFAIHPLTGWAFLAMCVSTGLHGLADAIVSEGKKMVDR